MFSRKINLSLWAALHLTVLIFFFLLGSPVVETSLYSILPDTNPVKELSPVEGKLSDTVNSNMTALVGHEDFSKAKEISRLFAAELEGTDGIESIQHEVTTSSLGDVQRYLHKYRYHFLTPEVQYLLAAGNGAALAERAYFTLSSPVSMGALDYIDEDPFLLAGDALQYFTSSGILGNMAVGVKDFLLTREWEGKHWILITFRSGISGVSVEMDGHPVPLVHEAAERIGAQFDGEEFIFSGVPFHSWDSAQKSQREISLLSTLSTLFIIIMILLVFRSFKPLAAAVTAIVMGILTGLAVTVILFQEIHIFTVVFGTSLIGISVDYSFHFFTEWAEGRRSRTVVRKILPGITTGLITTLLSYAAFTLSSFPLLQQMALFSIAGLTSTYLSVLFLYGNLRPPSERTKAGANRAVYLTGALFSRAASLPPAMKGGILAVLSIFSFLGLKDLKLNNNVRDLYTMSDQLSDWEHRSAQILDHGSSGVYLLIRGENLEDNLRKEEAIRVDLDELIRLEKLESSLGLSILLPSRKVQSNNLKLVRNHLLPLLENQLHFLGFGPGELESNRDAFSLLQEKYIDQNDLFSLPLSSLTDTLHIGEVNGGYYTSLMLFGIKDMDAMKTVAANHTDVYLINKVDDTNQTLGDLSRLALTIILVSYAVILGGLALRYGIKRALMVVLIPAAASLCTLSLVSLLNLPVNLFVIVGLILIPGMGTDYIILLFESEKRNHAVLLSITLSMMTSVLAFGLLGLTSIAGVFGTTAASGIFLTWFITLLLNRQEHRHQL